MICLCVCVCLPDQIIWTGHASGRQSNNVRMCLCGKSSAVAQRQTCPHSITELFHMQMTHSETSSHWLSFRCHIDRTLLSLDTSNREDTKMTRDNHQPQHTFPAGFLWSLLPTRSSATEQVRGL